MPSMRPPSASDPDGTEGWRFRELAEVDSTLAQRLLGEYGDLWVSASELPHERSGEVPDTLEVAVADEWQDDNPGLKRLRLTSWYTGSTYWLPDWDGDHEKAVTWIRDTAWLQAGNVRFQRYRYGRTAWDEEGEDRDEPLTDDEVQAWVDADAKRHPHPD